MVSLGVVPEDRAATSAVPSLRRRGGTRAGHALTPPHTREPRRAISKPSCAGKWLTLAGMVSRCDARAPTSCWTE